MTCPGCQRANAPERRYCGRCGCNLAPVCRRCSFHNECDDRYCGGCGELLVANETGFTPAPPHAAAHLSARPPAHLSAPGAPAAPAAPAPVPAPAPPKVIAMPDELSGLFAPPVAVDESQRLPERTIAQADLDRLFGGAL